MNFFQRYLTRDYLCRRYWHSFYTGAWFLSRFRDKGFPQEVAAVYTQVKKAEEYCLYRLARGLPDDAVALEIGSFHGASSMCLAAGMRGNQRLYCVDTFYNDATAEAREDVFPVFEKNTRKYQNRIKVIRGFSGEVSDRVPASLDFLFLDGDHSWEGARADLRHYLPKMRAGGVLAMHDVRQPDTEMVFHRYVLPFEVERKVYLPNFYAGICDYQKIGSHLNDG